MKGNPKVIEALNKGLTIELTAVNQYFVQGKMCANWGYRKLAKKHHAESIDEMKHAEALVERIIFLEGIPAIARYGVIRVGADVKEQLSNDLKLEIESVQAYNAGVKVAEESKDAVSRTLFEDILKKSEEHVDWLESQLHLIKTIGLPNYLAELMGEE